MADGPSGDESRRCRLPGDCATQSSMGPPSRAAMRMPVGPPARRVRGGRPELALLGGVLYVLGTIFLPGLHLFFHRLDHDHRGGGIHHHAGLVHAHEHRHDEASNSAPEPERLAQAPLEESASRLVRGGGAAVALVAPVAYARILPGSEAESPIDHAGGSQAHFASAWLKAAVVKHHIAGSLSWCRTSLPEPITLHWTPDPERSLGARGPPT